MEQPQRPAADAKSRAAAAAAAAITGVAPGQREQAIAKAVMAMQQQHAKQQAQQQQQEQEQKHQPGRTAKAAAGGSATATAPGSGDMRPPSSGGSAGAPKAMPSAAAPPGTYEPPEWAGVPEGVNYSMEVLKAGAVVEQRDLTHNDHYRFGRSPDADVVLEHPSASRLHAVLQFNGATKEAFLYDCSSTHGTFVNKERLKPRVHAPLRVGDTFRFGQSSRLYVLCGPSELMPEEGLNKQQRRQLALLEHAQKQKERDAEVARLQMESLLGRGEVTWGMAGEDATEDAAEAQARAQVDWRRFSEKNPLNDKQQKLADQIRRRELKVSNLRKECERIQAKESQDGGLTPGQASTLVRNERAMDALTEEIDDLEEALNESIHNTITDKAKTKEGQAAKATKRKRKPDSDDEYADASDSGDEFYDRTHTASTSGRGDNAHGARKRQAAAKEPPVVESAESLWGKREALREEKQRLEAAIAEELLRLAEQAQEGGTPSATAAHRVQDDNIDSLDAFMTDVETQMEHNKIASLQKELAGIQQQLERAEKLLHIADPDGWFNPGSAAARASKAKALQSLQQEKLKRAAAAAEKKRAQLEAAAPQAPEEEDEEGAATTQQQQVRAPASLHRLEAEEAEADSQAGLQLRTKPAAAAPASDAGPTPAGQGRTAAEPDAANERARQQAKELAAQFAEPAPSVPAKRPIKGPAMPPPKFQQPQPSSGEGRHVSADARVAAKLALLTGAGVAHGQAAEEGGGNGVAAAADDSSGAVWVPPTGQAGDGRTALNDRYGY